MYAVAVDLLVSVWADSGLEQHLYVGVHLDAANGLAPDHIGVTRCLGDGHELDVLLPVLLKFLLECLFKDPRGVNETYLSLLFELL